MRRPFGLIWVLAFTLAGIPLSLWWMAHAEAQQYASGGGAGTGSCTNQFVRANNSGSAPTCATVQPADVNQGGAFAWTAAQTWADAVTQSFNGNTAFGDTAADTVAMNGSVSTNITFTVGGKTIGGTAPGSGAAATITVRAPNGGSASGRGADLALTAGSGGSVNGGGGNVTINAGALAGSGANGYVYVGDTTADSVVFGNATQNTTITKTGTGVTTWPGAINASGVLTLSSAGTALSVTNNATIGGTAAVTGALTAASINVGTSTLLDIVSGTSSIDFGATAASTCEESAALTLTGVAIGDSCACGTPSAPAANSSIFCYVSAANTVRVRRCNVSTSALADPAAETYRITCFNF